MPESISARRTTGTAQKSGRIFSAWTMRQRQFCPGCLPEQDKGAQHNQHRRFGVAGTSQRTGENLIEAAQHIEGGHILQKHGTVLDHFGFAVKEFGKGRGKEMP